jgi:mycothiol S-conjugate amidase
MIAADLESPYGDWLKRWEAEGFEDRGKMVTTRVDCADYFSVRDDALRAHATQVDPDGFWFHVPLDLQQRVWPTEDYELARSFVDSRVPEDDLFAGIRETVHSR